MQSPRCPSCTFLVPTPGLCAVCAAGVPVHVVTGAEVAAYHALCNDRRPVPPREPAGRATPARPLGRPATTALGPPAAPPLPGPQDYPCDTPGCTGRAQYQLHGYARLRGNGYPVRCAPCKAAHKRARQVEYQAQYRQQLARRRAQRTAAI